MNVDVIVRKPGEPQLLLKAPLENGQPGLGDHIHIIMPDGVALFKVDERRWMFESGEEGKGITYKLVLVVVEIGMYSREEEGTRAES